MSIEDRFKQLHFESFVPLVRTKYGDSFVFTGTGVAYLTPWVDGGEGQAAQKEENLIINLAELHGYT
ncbi:hypothetical protein R0J90_14735, partial [Micrococcus sp. SIMBA_144]